MMISGNHVTFLMLILFDFLFKLYLMISVVLFNMVIGIIVDVMSRDARENLFDNIDANDHVVTKENEGL